MSEPDGLATREPISKPIAPRKQQAKRHYGSHPYFTKRAWNVVQRYIENFSKPGDVVLDPFGGSGVTAVEALVLRRRAIHVDLAPLANFITWGVAVSPVEIPAFQAEYASIRADCERPIRDLYALSDADVETLTITYWYPKGVPLPTNADVAAVDECFHRRSLIALSILLHRISEIDNTVIRDLFRLVFAATLNKTNLTFSSTTGRKESRGDSSIFRVYRYWVPPKTIELNVWEQFEHRYQGWLAAKRETNQLIGDFFTPETLRIVRGSATDLSDIVEPESIDYIYTDPPYGAHIAYLDLMTMWHAWLGFDVTPAERRLEVIEGGDLHKSKAEYESLLSQSISEMFRVLKWNRWLSIVFAHKDPAYWDAIVNAAQAAGFEYVNTAVQPSTTPSLHKRKNPLKVLSGELVLNFRKTRNPRTIAISSAGADVVELIKNTAELVIVRYHGASTEDIYSELIPVLLENGLLAIARKKIADVVELLREDFDFDQTGGVWRVRPNKKLGHFVPIEQRIRFYVTDHLNRVSRDQGAATFDEIVFHVLPNLINGSEPSEDSILDVLKKIAFSPDGEHWQLHTEGDTGAPVEQTQLMFSGIQSIPEIPVTSQPPHDEMIYRLAKLARATGILVHVGKKEQPSVISGEILGSLGKDWPAGKTISDWVRRKVEQIDCVYFARSGIPIYAFEVEASTTITSGIDRFMELLKVAPELARRLVLIIPRERERQLNRILRDSHYIGHPTYMENKLVWLYYEDLLRLYAGFVGKHPTPEMLIARLDSVMRLPKLERAP